MARQETKHSQTHPKCSFPGWFESPKWEEILYHHTAVGSLTLWGERGVQSMYVPAARYVLAAFPSKIKPVQALGCLYYYAPSTHMYVSSTHFSRSAFVVFLWLEPSKCVLIITGRSQQQRVLWRGWDPSLHIFPLHFCVVVVPDNFSPCTHHRAPVVHLTRGCVRCSVVGDWHAMPNIFRNWMPESWPPPNSSTSSALGILHPLSKHQWASLESLASTLSITASTLSVLFYSFSSLLPKAHKSSFGCVFRLCLLPDAHFHLLSIRSCRCAPSTCLHSKRNKAKEYDHTVSTWKFGSAQWIETAVFILIFCDY